MNEAKKKNYIVNSVYRSFLLVCVLSMVSATLGGLIDNVIVGRFLGTEALGAMGIVSPVMFLFMALGVLCASGGAILVSQALGQGDTARVRNVFSTAVCFDALAGVIVCALGLVFVRPLAALLGARGTLAELSVQYLRGFLFSAPAVIALGVLMQLVQIDGSPRLTLLATVVMTVSDVVFDLLVVVLHAGMLGMALATTLSNYLAVAVLAFHFRKDSCTLKLVRPRSPLRAFRSMALTSLPAVMTVGGDLVRTTILNNWLAAISVAAVAALNVRAQAQNLIGALALGGAQAIAAMTAMFYGEADREAIGLSLRSALWQGLSLNCAVAVIFALIPSVFPQLMGLRDGEALQMARAAVRWLAVSLPLRFVNLLLSQYYQSTRRTARAVVISLMEVLIAPVLLAALLKGPFGVTGVWLAFPAAEVLTLLLILAFLSAGKTHGALLDRVLALPEGFGGEEADKLSVSIGNSMDEVMALIGQAYAFGEERGVPRRTLDKLALCIEEMAGNIVQHAFPPGQQRWFDLLIYVKPDSIFLRMRDNGRPFDPLACLRERAQDDPEATLGLKVINGITDSFEHRSGVGLNISLMTLRRE